MDGYRDEIFSTGNQLVVDRLLVELEALPATPEDDVEIETEWEVDEEGCPDSWVLT